MDYLTTKHYVDHTIGMVQTEAKPDGPYTAKRQVLAENQKLKKKTHRRYNSIYAQDISFHGMGACNQRVFGKCNREKVRNDLIKQFPIQTRAITDDVLKEFKALKQNVDGSCTFAAFLAMLYLGGNGHLIPSPGWNGAHTLDKKGTMFFESHWWEMFGLKPGETVMDIAELLDRIRVNDWLDGHKQLRESILQNVKYVPIRSNDAREDKYNQEFWNKKETMDRYLSNSINKEETYENEKTILETARLIERQLEKFKNPVEFNMNGHSMCVVGFNDTHVLTAGSWGNEVRRTYANAEMAKVDRYDTGFHIQNKWTVYASVRDLCYMKREEDNLDYQ